jgi:hypothetical protein
VSVYAFLLVIFGVFWSTRLKKLQSEKVSIHAVFGLFFCIKKAMISNQGSGWAGGNRTLILWLIHAVFLA